MKSSRSLDLPPKGCWLVHGGSSVGVRAPAAFLSIARFVAPLGVGACLWFPAALPAASQQHPNASSHANYDVSQDFFTNGIIPHLVIEIKGTNLANLQRNDRVSVRATVRDGDTVYEDVGIHVKGAAGSRRSLSENPALTLNFDKFQEHQKFHGLDKIHLNNSVQDGSLMSELLCGYLFRAAGVPAARTTHARVRLNGRDLGLYVVKEGFNKSFLRQYFKNVNGNLYDGGFLREISEPLQQMSGNETNGYAPLQAVVAAAQEPDPAKRMQRLERVLDLDRFLSLMAMEVMTWHWDGYAMKRNNYRVYHDPDTDRIVFFAHGMDQMFWEPNGPVLPPNLDGLVARSRHLPPDALVQPGRRRSA
jgi:spore coat protein CotH